MSNVRSLYIHVPFCRKKCVYCDFYSAQYSDQMAAGYVDAILSQVGKLYGIFDTVFIGGGTPTVLDKALLGRFLGALSRLRNEATEFTVEANPESLSEDKIELMLKCGVNRLSIGVQSLYDKKLSRLGRVHDARSAIKAVTLASKKGFKNIGIDLMYGVWDESLEDWKKELEEAVRLPVTHISCYGLTCEKGTPLSDALDLGSVKPLEDEIVAGMYEYTIDRLTARGFRHYEVSNYARDGFRCRHNLNYWDNGEYIGLGPSAVSYIDGCRSENTRDVKEYVRLVKDGRDPVVSTEKLPQVKMAKETAAVKIRTKDGIDAAWFRGRTGLDLFRLEGKAIKELVDKELIKYIKVPGPDAGGRISGIRPTRRGFLFCDTVSSTLL